MISIDSSIELLTGTSPELVLLQVALEPVTQLPNSENRVVELQVEKAHSLEKVYIIVDI